ncbi:hypothetical protein [Spiroplasma cantharicola]|uniref:Lipoprotein n=1 Tax=Spiroplasma cantharicola TaxID=362837 RepID=A0A0M3SJ97_9MOLU|nr:hypothetical protein [Spiroplasma cantharicola]ALD66354.1 hypothetical protein SCANT_v1c04480 [Spiroplasma cantharicola]
MKKLLNILGGALFATSSATVTMNTVSCEKEYTKDDFEKLVKEISNLDESKYTEESIAYLFKILEETTSEVNEGKNINVNYTKLKKAFESLVLKETENGELKEYKLKDLFDNSLFEGDAIKLNIVFDSQLDYENRTKDNSAIRNWIWNQMQKKYISQKFELKKW